MTNKFDTSREFDLDSTPNQLESNQSQLNTTTTTNSLQFTKSKRYFILLLISSAGILAPLASTIYLPSQKTITTELNASNIMYDASISVFMVILAIFPLFWGDISDRFGRKGPLAAALTISLAGFTAGALANNMEVIIVSRIFSSIGSAAPLVTGVGTLTDIFPPAEIGSVMSLFFIGILLGPILGPMLGGVLDEFLGWRSTFWFMAIHCGINLILVIMFIPETLPINSRQPYPFTIDSRLRLRRTGPLFNPFRPLIYLRHPIVLITSLVYATPFGAFFGVESFHSRAMKDIYQLNSSIIGVSFLVLGVGGVIGNSVGGILSDRSYQRHLKTHPDTTPPPELRLDGIWYCVLSITLGLLMYAWFLQYELHLAYSLTATFLIGFGYASSSIGCATYLVNLSPSLASSITGSALFLRMLMAGIVTSGNTLIMERLDYGYGISLYALLSALAIPLVLILQWRGEWLKLRWGPHS